jgi:TolA-binding protein
MKKIIISTVLIGTLLFTLTPSVQAKQELFKFSIPVWFSQAIKPFQNALEALTGKVDNHEARIAELEGKVADLEEKVRQLESRWITNQPVNTGELTIEGGGGNTLINSNGNQEEISTGSQGELNIGSQGSNTDNLYILNPPNTSDVNLSNQP